MYRVAGIMSMWESGILWLVPMQGTSCLLVSLIHMRIHTCSISHCYVLVIIRGECLENCSSMVGIANANANAVYVIRIMINHCTCD